VSDPRSAHPDAESVNQTEDLWGRVWDTLDLPAPRLRRFASLAQWAAWEEWQVYRRRRESAGTQWVLWEFLYPRGPNDPVASPEMRARLQRWMDLESQSRPEAPPAFSEVTALRALDFLHEIEQRCRDSGKTEELAVCLTVEAVLLGRALGRFEEAEQLFEETWALGEGEDGWRVRAAVEQVVHFLNGEGSAGDYLGFFPGA